MLYLIDWHGICVLRIVYPIYFNKLDVNILLTSFHFFKSNKKSRQNKRKNSPAAK